MVCACVRWLDTIGNNESEKIVKSKKFFDAFCVFLLAVVGEGRPLVKIKEKSAYLQVASARRV